MARRLKQTKSAKAARARYRRNKAARGGTVRRARGRGRGRGRGKGKKGGWLGALASIAVPMIGELIGSLVNKK